MIHVNLLPEVIYPIIHRMPAAEFGQRGVENSDGYIYEVEVSPSLTLVLAEQQLIELVECALDALPPMSDEPADDDAGEAWKEVA